MLPALSIRDLAGLNIGALMTDTQKRKFAIAHVGLDGRVALCEIFGDVIK